MLSHSKEKSYDVNMPEQRHIQSPPALKALSGPFNSSFLWVFILNLRVTAKTSRAVHWKRPDRAGS